MRITLIVVAAACGAIALVSCVPSPFGDDRPPPPLAPHVDLDRMYGGWYLIATIPNFVEKGIVQPYDVYSRRPDGDIREDFSMRRGGFDAELQHFTVHDWVRAGTNNAHWRVQILWPINLPFLVLYVDPDYRFVIYGEANRQLGWIYARTQVVSDADYAALLDRLKGLGYDPATFKRFVQLPSQLGQPGFWSEGITAPLATAKEGRPRRVD